MTASRRGGFRWHSRSHPIAAPWTWRRSLYSRGLVDFLSVLDAQRALFIAEDAACPQRHHGDRKI
jgi:hypothetical protein